MEAPAAPLPPVVVDPCLLPGAAHSSYHPFIRPRGIVGRVTCGTAEAIIEPPVFGPKGHPTTITTWLFQKTDTVQHMHEMNACLAEAIKISDRFNAMYKEYLPRMEFAEEVYRKTSLRPVPTVTKKKRGKHRPRECNE